MGLWVSLQIVARMGYEPHNNVWGDVLYAKHVQFTKSGHCRPLPFNLVINMSDRDLIALSERMLSWEPSVQNLLCIRNALAKYSMILFFNSMP